MLSQYWRYGLGVLVVGLVALGWTAFRDHQRARQIQEQSAKVQALQAQIQAKDAEVAELRGRYEAQIAFATLENQASSALQNQATCKA